MHCAEADYRNTGFVEDASFRVLLAGKLHNVVSQLSQINRRYHYGLMLADGCRGNGLWPAKSFPVNDGRDRAINEN